MEDPAGLTENTLRQNQIHNRFSEMPFTVELSYFRSLCKAVCYKAQKSIRLRIVRNTKNFISYLRIKF